MSIRSQPASDKFREGWDEIFQKKNGRVPEDWPSDDEVQDLVDMMGETGDDKSSSDPED